MSKNIIIRLECDDDIQDVRFCEIDAFKTNGEADLVDALRSKGKGVLSLVAVDKSNDNRIVGHCFFSEVRLENEEEKLIGLGPIGVLKSYQKQGIGGKLIKVGLEKLKDRYLGCCLLGSDGYYPRFGFVPAGTSFNITSEYIEDPNSKYWMIYPFNEEALLSFKERDEPVMSYYEEEFKNC
eukprot:TRINITY_DN7201_c0_g4_i1.p1 TRINITY_DN7201_c0_g4~~TRINITY_DN7201_c0_g4_i1.p1  ORF type:complete len:181 (-),score=58.16 TRINITY_DN7201_c0_g4_i1:533-1075(-)